MRELRKLIAAQAVAVMIAVGAWAVEPARYSPDAGPHQVLKARAISAPSSAPPLAQPAFFTKGLQGTSTTWNSKAPLT
jgi:hypothetical protein